MRWLAGFALGWLGLPGAFAQRLPADPSVGIRFAATRANAPPGTCGCFWMSGGGADVSLPLLRGLSAVVDVAGTTVDRVPETQRGLSVITLLAGPRYMVPLRRVSVSGQVLLGAARGFDADFHVGTRRSDTSTSFGMSLGALLEVPIRGGPVLRPLQVEYLRTNLPNGVDDRQRNLRVGVGLGIRFGNSK